VFRSKEKVDNTIKDDNAHIAVSTSGSHRRYQTIDSICDLASATADIGGQVRVQDAFRLLKNKLRRAAVELGGDAVIDCQFHNRGAHSGGLAPAHAIELWGFGTVVKFEE
jgi:hypothetical protein